MVKKNKLTREEIVHLGHLARLKLNEEEIKNYQRQLAETVDYIGNLNELKTQKVKPTSQAGELTNVFFEDGQKNQRHLENDEVLKNAKRKKNNFFATDKIFGI